MQIKSFTTWCNLHLVKVGMEINNLQTDFADGLRLINLVEIIADETLGKYNKKPMSKFQKVENLNIALHYINDFIKAQGISNQYSAENILEENEVLILGMVWSLILRFAVQDISEGDRTAKEGLLLWAQKKVDEGSKGMVPVKNFHTSWADGMAFCALIQACRPDLIDYKSCRKSEDPAVKMQNLDMAFGIAEKSLGIPKMLDPKDMVAARPDEKSVMTYISFFWKEFASNKKRQIAAEQIATALARERQFAEMQAQYDAQMAGLVAWIESKHEAFSMSSGDIPPAELAARLDSYMTYGQSERPAKIQEMMEVEALYHAIHSRMNALGREFVPSESLSLESMHRWWERMTAAEQAYEEGIKSSLRGVKKLGRLVKLFNSKASKAESWLATKAAWLQCSHDVATTELGKERVLVVGAEDEAGGAPPPPPPTNGDSVDERLPDPTSSPMAPVVFDAPPEAASPMPAPPPPEAFDESATPGTERGRSWTDGSPSAAPPSEAPSEVPTEATPKEGSGDAKEKRPSFFGDLFASIQENLSRRDSSASSLADKAGTTPVPARVSSAEYLEGAATPNEAVAAEPVAVEATLDERLQASMSEVVAPPTPTKSESAGAVPHKSPVLRSRKSLSKYSEELKSEASRQASGGNAQLDSVSAVLAKINLFKAYEEEQANREQSIGALRTIVEQLRLLSCPVMDQIEKRFTDCEAGFAALATAAAAYRADLDECLAKHKELDDKRLAFAKRAEALNRWTEESIDAQHEPVDFDSMAEASAAESEMGTFRAELAEKRNECASLRDLREEMDAAGAGPNPYSRFQVADIEAGLAEAELAAEERVANIAKAREKISVLDEQKKSFAALAEDVLAFARKEKAALEVQEKAVGTIHPDDAESIMRGKEALAQFNEYAGKAAERSAMLATPKKVSDGLMAAAEMDNPYTRQSMASLTSAIDQLEKLVRDAINLVEGQLARATANITPSQHAELQGAFKHFDKTEDGHLNKLEFVAAMKSLDFEGEATDAEFEKYGQKKAVKGWDGEDKMDKCIDFDSFLTIVLQQHKSKDTMDGLLAAFRALANGKDTLPPEELQKSLKPADVDFLTAHLTPTPDGLDYVPFTKAVYGEGTVAPVQVS